jgi:diguanylate cyclase
MRRILKVIAQRAALSGGRLPAADAAAGSMRSLDPIRYAKRGGEGLVRRSRLASTGAILILLGLSVFAVWTSQATASATTDAADASRLSDGYADATRALATEESLERKYRLEPSARVRASHHAAAIDLVQALRRVRVDGGTAGEQRLSAHVLVQHAQYLAATAQLFAAVDRGHTATALKIDGSRVDPVFSVIYREVSSRADTQHDTALGQLARLQRLQRLTRRLTPAGFGLGLLLAGLLVVSSRGNRRILVAERTHAVYESLHDQLTGLPNRALLTDRFEQALRAGTRTGTPAGLLLIDIDRFKDVNDTLGHRHGDDLLTLIGRRLVASLRTGDTVARLSGDEFAVLLPGIADVAAVTAVADELQHALQTPFHVAGIDLDIEASIGVVLSGEHGDDATTLLQRADIAMYVAKTQHPRVFAYDGQADQQSRGKLRLLGELRRALSRHELVLHYQPKISISTGEVVAAEALVRWQHPTRGLIYPDAFIDAVERTGLIGPLTGYVLDAAAGEARRWVDAGWPMPVSVNLSAHNLLDDHLPDQIARLLVTHGVPAELLMVEVTESAIMTNPDRARRLLRRIRELGVRISIDDFGVGYTSLSELKTMPVSELKIDRSFITAITEDADDAHIVASIVDLGHNLGLTIVAEGVETAQALAVLAGLACDVAQGYYYSPALASHAFDRWRRDHRPGPGRLSTVAYTVDGPGHR